MTSPEKEIGSLVVIGGGIAGVTCAQVLSLDNPNLPVVLISASSLVKVVTNFRTVGRSIDIFDVIERSSSAIQERNLKVINQQVIQLDNENRHVKLSDNTTIKYSKLCICSGAKLKVISVKNNKAKRFIKYIRDVDTAKDLQSILSNSKRILIVGNGGIATELIHEVTDCEMVWVFKDENFGATFFDAAVSKFFSDFLNEPPQQNTLSKRHLFTADQSGNVKSEFGVALGPDWHLNYVMKGKNRKNIIIEKNCNISEVYLSSELPPKKLIQLIKSTNDKWNIFVELSNGHIYGCDTIISAIGVVPNSKIFTKNNSFNICSIGGLLVDKEMQTNIKDIYAAGDVCTVNWTSEKLFFQMRLWTQARKFGYYAAKCITSHMQKTSPALYFNFDVFAHVTRFFGFRVILLGLFNGQNLKSNEITSILYKVIERKELIKVILKMDKMVGAVLIGETNYEETFENLIFNQIDLSRFGDNLLDDTLDLEDYFD